ncbi:MAG: plastocyanin/azurin family copper-binding protein [Thermoproteota archaeon]|nr:plastocyanin/azurin family copper-binding protein [Thermoproteota archaeon]
MSVIHEKLFFAVLAMIAVSLLIFGIVQNSGATSSEIRIVADLNPPTNLGEMADGRADYRERGTSMRLNVEVEDVFPNSTFTVEISGEPIGTIRTSSFGIGELELNTNDGQAVPKILGGDLVQILQGTQLVLSGGFDAGGDGNIENDDNQVPITPPQNSSMQVGSNSSSAITTVITVPQDADDLGAGAFSPDPASVSAGSTITWNNIDDSPHTATADDGSFDTGIINGGSSGSALISASTGMRAIPYHCNVHPEMRGTLQVIALSTVPSSNSTLQNAPVTVTDSTNSPTIQNLQEAILALQQAIGSLQQALVALQQSASQDGNVTIFSGNNNTAGSPIQEEQLQPALPPPQQQLQSQQQQQGRQQNLTVSIVQGSSTLTDNGGFQPNPIQLQAGDTVIWRNDDLEAHTVTSGSNGVPDNKFNSSPNFIPLITPGTTFSHTFTQAGEYPYFCLLHPNMVGTVIVVS